jgi:hypothetical protein
MDGMTDQHRAILERTASPAWRYLRMSPQNSSQPVIDQPPPSAEITSLPSPATRAEKNSYPYSACPSMIGPNNCHFSPVNFIICTCSIG